MNAKTPVVWVVEMWEPWEWVDNLWKPIAGISFTRDDARAEKRGWELRNPAGLFRVVPYVRRGE